VVSGLSPDIRFQVYNADITTCERAVKERLFFVERDGIFVPPPKPVNPEVFNLRCSDFKRKFKRLVSPTAPLTPEQFVGSYKGRQRTCYEKALKSLRERLFRKQDAYIRYFVKCEKVNFTLKRNPAPRGISPRSPRYHVMLGPYIKRVEKKIYRLTKTIFDSTVIFKGLNASQSATEMRSHWDHFDDPVAIGLDASRFDQHVSFEALKFEHSFYKMFYPKDKLLSRLLGLQLVNKGFAYCKDGKLTFKLKGGRMSGDMNTGLGNCLLMVAMVHSYCRAVGITKFRLANNGDDCVLIIEQRDYRKTQTLDTWFLEMGFTMKREAPVKVFEEIEFCQTHPVWTPDGYVMVRNVLLAWQKML